MRTRWSAYAGVSVALAGGVVVKALAQRPNFYSAAVYLSQSSANLMVSIFKIGNPALLILTNMIFVVACSMLLGLQKLLYGPLRPIEIEQLYEKAWFAVTETCLAMTIFRGEIGAWFLVMFFALLAGKVWAWIGEGRVEVLEQQPPRNPRLFHTRLALSLGLSVCFDLTMLEYVVKEVMHMARPDMMVMFGFEFAVLSLVSLSTAARYAINLVEIGIVRKQKAKRVEEIRKERMETATRAAEQSLQQATSDSQTTSITQGANGAEAVSNPSPEERLAAATDAMNTILAAGNQPIDDAELEVEGWEGKGRWIFYLDLATDFFKLVVYLSFFFILLIFYGLPIHILRDVFMTCRSFFKRIADFMRYRTATRDMNDRYPDATEHEIGREDVCIICREEMRPYQPTAEGTQTNPVAERMRPKKLPCGHILHFSCLRSWLERQQICPTCRTSVVPTRQTRTGQPDAPATQGAEGQHGNAGDGGGGGANNRAAARVFRIGPLRIGVGAARGNNMLEDLQNRLGDQEPREGAAANGNGGQQFGFGIRWDGMRRRDRERRGRRPVQDQLDSAERQIQRELNSLGGSLAELQVLRNMEGELARLRALRHTSSTRSASPRTDLTVTALTGDRQHILQAGNENLPAGLILPEGWSMMPLQPLQGPLPHIPIQQLHQPMPLPMHIPASAMFTMPGQAPYNHQAFAQPIPNTAPVPTATQPRTASPQQANDAPAAQSQSSPAAGMPNTPADGVLDITRTMAEVMAEHARNVHTHAQGATSPGSGSHSQLQQPASTMAPSREMASGTHTIPSVSASAPTATYGQQPPIGNSVPSLPAWGSGADTTIHNAIPSTPEDQRSVRTDGDIVREASHTADRDSAEVQESESNSSSKSRSATVEDLVEDPD